MPLKEVNTTAINTISHPKNCSCGFSWSNFKRPQAKYSIQLNHHSTGTVNFTSTSKSVGVCTNNINSLSHKVEQGHCKISFDDKIMWKITGPRNGQEMARKNCLSVLKFTACKWVFSLKNLLWMGGCKQYQCDTCPKRIFHKEFNGAVLLSWNSTTEELDPRFASGP